MPSCIGCSAELTDENTYAGKGVRRSRCKPCFNRSVIDKRYNVSVAELLVKQDSRCGLCDAKLDVHVHVDHDHRCCPRLKSCGRCIRGLLCRACNIGLGHFKDDPELLLRAAAYVEAGIRAPVG